MLLDAVLAAAHFIAIFLLITFLAIETVLCRREWMPGAAARLARYDLLYFLMAVTVLATGLLRLYLGAHGTAMLLPNPLFHAKVGLFVLIGLISVYPTRRFQSWRRSVRTDAAFVPQPDDLRRVRICLMLETHLIVLLPILAACMARGIGL
ncbi:DUF2214 family protein [Chitiniphilus purpureus]|uniref:DUF2214 family protein n=1 Tax=Chitiniphilus purpureus TaxID=2981137 RepID=A0ABY6DSI1_9NEIS|nr:DUF2214 family protein [Chitiniphilus sp. CD1]UXY17193.1 DUF2214 family protein [Chitiniphilus sp. CD1]